MWGEGSMSFCTHEDLRKGTGKGVDERQELRSWSQQMGVPIPAPVPITAVCGVGASAPSVKQATSHLLCSSEELTGGPWNPRREGVLHSPGSAGRAAAGCT